MTVKELITELHRCPEDSEVFVRCRRAPENFNPNSKRSGRIVIPTFDGTIRIEIEDPVGQGLLEG